MVFLHNFISFYCLTSDNQTIPWLRSITKLPIVLKGIQCVEDAVLAVEAGVDGILISNHGGENCGTFSNLNYLSSSLKRSSARIVGSETYVSCDSGLKNSN